jgi:hypothetical protein
VLEAEDEQRSEWFDDTIEYIGERYPELAPDELVSLRTIGERYCAPAISNATRVSEAPAEESTDGEADEDKTVAVEATLSAVADSAGVASAGKAVEEVVDTGEASAA